MSSQKRTRSTPEDHPPRYALIAHLRQQLERDPQAYLQGKLATTARLIVQALSEAETDPHLAAGALEAAAWELEQGEAPGV